MFPSVLTTRDSGSLVHAHKQANITFWSQHESLPTGNIRASNTCFTPQGMLAMLVWCQHDWSKNEKSQRTTFSFWCIQCQSPVAHSLQVDIQLEAIRYSPMTKVTGLRSWRQRSLFFFPPSDFSSLKKFFKSVWSLRAKSDFHHSWPGAVTHSQEGALGQGTRVNHTIFFLCSSVHYNTAKKKKKKISFLTPRFEASFSN